MQSGEPSSPVRRDLPTREGYDLWSQIYDAEANPLVELEEPQITRMLGDFRGLQIADIGCGTGRHAIRLARQAASITALDFSPGMLARATAKLGAADIRWINADLTRPLPLADRLFDRVLCLLVMDHIPDPTALIRELARICKPDGFILISAIHPAMYLRGVSARFVDPASGHEIRPGALAHKISDYIMAALNAPSVIAELSEHAVSPEQAAANPRAAKYLDWPLLFLMKLIPPPNP